MDTLEKHITRHNQSFPLLDLLVQHDILMQEFETVLQNADYAELHDKHLFITAQCQRWITQLDEKKQELVEKHQKAKGN